MEKSENGNQIMQGSKCILVTGGAGFIGSHLVQRLVNSGQYVIVIDDFNDYYDPAFKEKNIAVLANNKNFKLYRGDITDFDFLNNIFNEDKIDKIVHLAARSGVRSSITNPILYQEVNVIGTQNILELARLNNIKDFIFASSSSVYGDTTQLPFSEDMSADRQISPYGATKRSAELLIYVYHYLYKMNCVCLRFFNVYGEGGRPDMVSYLFTESLFKTGTIKKFGDGTTARGYTYIDDIVDGIIRCFDKNFGYEIINLGNNNLTTLNDLIKVLEYITKIKAKIISLPEQLGDIKVNCADISKAKRLLGWEPKVKIKEGLQNFVRWYKKSDRF